MSQNKNDTINAESKNEKDPESSSNVEETSPTIDPTEKWLIRDCDIYEDEYDDCTSFKARFNQYFIYGGSLDCNQWKKDYVNCCKWVKNNDTKAANELIKSEKIRRMRRLTAHYQNDTWKKRESPPTDWEKPLPEWMIKRDQNTYLAQKAQEMKEGKVVDDKSSCVIM
ncbi:UPF0545 protein C22orf39 homolog [Nymphalis io]|uniref:UPF0545 protein C22orf39 homolog n=1 Tax=Inachis io TaxID=171585 RepID=UPI0021687118|nr:UPF0545 protein C22orf39 homolog [Nymphalis io]XP_050345503.1 UPF0545 protein C22orf39 homolog [Nymphalis io]XP_050345504.1 UPF0545 protein C22orf39 homolog [Nymphalis io]